MRRSRRLILWLALTLIIAAVQLPLTYIILRATQGLKPGPSTVFDAALIDTDAEYKALRIQTTPIGIAQDIEYGQVVVRSIVRPTQALSGASLWRATWPWPPTAISPAVSSVSAWDNLNFTRRATAAAGFPFLIIRGPDVSVATTANSHQRLVDFTNAFFRSPRLLWWGLLANTIIYLIMCVLVHHVARLLARLLGQHMTIRRALLFVAITLALFPLQWPLAWLTQPRAIAAGSSTEVTIKPPVSAPAASYITASTTLGGTTIMITESLTFDQEPVDAAPLLASEINNWPWNGREIDRAIAARSPNEDATLRALGWPWPCVYAIEFSTPRWMSPLIGLGTNNVFTTTRTLGELAPTSRGPANWPLGYLPIWRGLLTNTLILAIPTCLLLFIIFIIIDRRRKPWSCKTCNYDLRGLTCPTCPECGTTRHH